VFTAWRRHDPAGALTKLMRAGVSEARRATHEHYPDGVPAATPGVVAEVAAGLARIVAATRSRAPAARVLLVDYLTVLDAHSRSAVVDFAADELDACRALQSALVEGYAVAARHSGADLVPVSRLSRGHGLGSAEPWVSDFIPEVRRTVGSFHPNAVGMRAIADILGRHLGW
jgi:hypothetical protein